MFFFLTLIPFLKRLEIFEIHTRSMRENGLLSEGVVLSELAANTTGYSGAEIAGCVRAASSYALERQVVALVGVACGRGRWRKRREGGNE